MKKLILALTLAVSAFGAAFSQTSTADSGTTTTIYVSTSGSDHNSGSSTSPMRTINAALNKADGYNSRNIPVVVSLASGVYREDVAINPHSGMTGAAETLEAQTAGGAIIAASDIVTGFRALSSTEYLATWHDTVADCNIPSSWPAVLRIANRAEMVFVNGQALTQIINKVDAHAGTFYVDTLADQLHVYPVAGTDMSKAKVEVSARRSTLTVQGRSNITLRGIVLEHAASCMNTNGANVYSSNNVLADNIQARWNNWGGFYVSSSNNVTVLNSTFNFNGGVGLGGYKNTGINFLGDESDYNGWRPAMAAFYDFGMGGTKLMLTHGGIVTGLKSYRNQAQGLWFDTDNKNILVANTVSSENLIANLKLEANQGPVAVTSSILCSSGAGALVLNTEGITMVGNTFVSNGGTSKWQADFFLGGTPSGRHFTDWQSHQNLSTMTTHTTLSGNSFNDELPSQYAFSTYMSGSFWTNFVSTLKAGLNSYFNPSKKTTFYAEGHDETLSSWQNITGRDITSTWTQTNLTCKAPTNPYPDFHLEANNRENQSASENIAPYDMTNGVVVIPLQVKNYGMVGPIDMQMHGLPSGVTASFSPVSIITGTTNLTLRASVSAVRQTIVVNAVGVNGGRFHSVSLLVKVQ